MDFYVDTWVRQKDAETQRGSDREHIEALIRAKGYKMPTGMMYVYVKWNSFGLRLARRRFRH